MTIKKIDNSGLRILLLISSYVLKEFGASLGFFINDRSSWSKLNEHFPCILCVPY